jgi:hypothetical protein
MLSVRLNDGPDLYRGFFVLFGSGIGSILMPVLYLPVLKYTSGFWALSSSGQSAVLIRPRYMVRPHERPQRNLALAAGFFV